MVDHYSVIHYLYENFYRKKYGNEKYKFKPSEKYLIAIDKFLLYLDKKYNLETIGVNYLINYFVFQFEFWDDLVITTISEKITLPMILGKNAINRFNNRDTKYDYQLQSSEFVKKHNILLSEIKNKFSESDSNKINRFEELEKNRFHNTSRGFLNCIEKISLFNHYSLLCNSCNYKIECKELLKNNYNQVYIDRGYGEKE